jgi:hypothetical protein
LALFTRRSKFVSEFLPPQKNLLGEEEISMPQDRNETQSRKAPNRIRLTAQLPEALNSHLRNYVDAAKGASWTDSTLFLSGATVSAVGLGILSLPLANAEVVYTPANQSINENARKLSIDFNHDGVADASLSVGGYCLSGSDARNCFGTIFAFGFSGNQVMTSGGEFASAARAGKLIGQQDKFQASPEMARCRTGFNGFSHSSWRTLQGPWLDVQHRYLGFKFQIDGETHYGWARITTSGLPCYPSAHLTGYAYETVANRPIVAGITQSEAAEQMKPLGKDAVAERYGDSASLGVLAVGAPGLEIWRKPSDDEAR